MNCGMQAEIIKYRATNDIDVQFEDGSIAEHRAYSAFKKGSILNPIHIVGKEQKMKCGLNATIIYCKSYEYINVRFEDGTIIEHSTYSSFKNGTISYPTSQNNQRRKDFREDRIGKKRMINCGMEAEIIVYRKYDDIDVQFENGFIVEHRKYDSFLRGSINNPSISKKNIHKKNSSVQKTKVCNSKKCKKGKSLF